LVRSNKKTLPLRKTEPRGRGTYDRNEIFLSPPIYPKPRGGEIVVYNTSSNITKK